MNTQPLSERVLQYGLTEVYSSEAPEVDLIFVHGLGGNPYSTWLEKSSGRYWPSDLLPVAVQDQKCRILTYGYEANVVAFTDGASKDRIHNHAERLASKLVANRSLRKALERPIVFVCHSLGGLVVKRCLIHSANSRHLNTERQRSIYVSTYGILFLGTPHGGSSLAKLGSSLERISSAVLPKKFLDSSPQLVQALKTNNETLVNINRLFAEIIRRFHIFFFHESKPTDFHGTLQFVVDEESAAPTMDGSERCGIEQNHSNMCKFESEEAAGFDVVAEAIQRYAEDAPALIRTRWQEEKQIREFEKKGAAKEILGDSMLIPTLPSNTDASAEASKSISRVSSAMSMRSNEQESYGRRTPELQGGPPLVAPLHFRPNSLFVGFQTELLELHERLFLKNRHELGTRCVLVWGQPGCGKSFLARQFFFKYRQDFPSGTFWVDCKSTESILSSYWDIAVSIGVSIEDQDTKMTTNRRSSESLIDTVRKTLENMDPSWLLIFDGLAFDTEEEISAFQRYIPDSTGNCIIYTSVDSTLRGRQRLLEPVAIKVHPLSQDEASKLLFKNLGLHRPNAIQKSKAAELVKDYHYLPLGIHAASHVLIEQGKALETYTRTITDSRLTSPFLEILSALHDKAHVEALNLINLLSFFNHTIPVALLLYGAKSLDDYQLDILSPKRGARKDLDSTIAILIRSGLLERSLQAYTVNNSGDASPEDSRSIGRIENNTTTIISHSKTRSATQPQHELSSLDMILPNNDTPKVESSAFPSISAIDVLHVNSTVQTVIRQDLRDRNLGDKREYYWWLIAAVHLIASSFSTAQQRIKRSPGYGLVRDYREYEVQVAKLWSFFPKSSGKASNELRKSRHELHEIWRMIKSEIRSQSPSESSSHSGQVYRNSIFERASASSDAETQSSISDLTRASTWSLDPSHYNESPSDLDANRENQKAVEDDAAVLSDTDSWASRSDTTEIPSNNPAERTRRTSILRAIFQGNSNQTQKFKDLGQWKPLPAPPNISHPEVQVARSRSTSRKSSDERQPRPISAGSEAEAALAAIHRFSPPASRGGRIRSPSRGLNTEDFRKPLSPKSGNAQLSPLATEFQPGSGFVLPKTQSLPKAIPKQPATSPRLVQALLVNRAKSTAGNLFSASFPTESTDRIPAHVYSDQPTALSSTDFGVSGLPNLPTGYSSVPMSRQISESDYHRNSEIYLKPRAAQRVLSDSQLPKQNQSIDTNFKSLQEQIDELRVRRG